MAPLPGFAVDPVLGHAAAAALALVLVFAAVAKLRDLELFQHAVANYELLPPSLLAPAARVLPFAELAAGVLLLPVATRPLGAALAIALLLALGAAIAAALRAGRGAIDCGCGGLGDSPGAGPTLSRGLVVRNGLLAGVAALAALPLSGRATGWLDIVATLAAALAFTGLYALANQLLANQPRLDHLRNAP